MYDGNETVASSSLFNTDIQGVFTGSFTSRFFGLTAAKRQYRLNVEPDEAAERCRGAFSEMGRRVRLATAPDALAMVFYPHFHNPFLMTAEFDGKQMLVHYYSSRTPASLVYSRLSFSAWEKKMPEASIQRVEPVTIKPQIIKPEYHSNTNADGNAEGASGDKTDAGANQQTAGGKDVRQ